MHHHKYPLDNKYLLLGWKTAINRKLFQELGLTRLVKNFSLLQEWSRAESVSHKTGIYFYYSQTSRLMERSF